MAINAYSGSLPWTYGKNVSGLLTSSEALTEAGLDWGVRKEPLVAHLTLPDNSVINQPVKGKYTITRDDNNCPIGIVGKNFRAVPNQEAAALLDSFAEEAEAKFDYAGSIGDGERVWFKVSLPKSIRIKDNPDEVVGFNLVLSNAFNGSKSLEMNFVPVLNNQSIVLNTNTHKSDSMSIRHTSMYDTHIKEVRRVLKLSETYFDSVGEMFNNLADIPVGKDKFLEVMDKIMPLPVPDPATGETPNATRAENTRAKLESLVYEQNAISPFPNTGWSTFVAIASYNDHERTFKTKKDEEGSQADIRFLSILEGTSQKMKNEALEVLLGLK